MMEEIDKTIKEQMNKRVLTISSLARMTGLSYMTIKKLIQNGCETSYLNTVLHVCDVMDIKFKVIKEETT